MCKWMLSMDVGGTSIKYAVFGEEGTLISGSGGQIAIDSDGKKEKVLASFTGVARQAYRCAALKGARIVYIGVSFPGPFDYVRSISLMEHKFAAIKNVPLPPVLLGALPGAKLRFLHDSTAFLLGEAFYGAVRGAQNPAGVMLGTGFGFAVMRDRRVCIRADQRPSVILWNAAYRDGIVEDYVSRRAIRARYLRLSGTTEELDVKEIAALAQTGDAAALETMQETGRLLGDILRSPLGRLGCDSLVIGGQIARSADLFLGQVQSQLDIPVRVAEHMEDAALRGAFLYTLRGEVETTIMTGETELMRK